MSCVTSGKKEPKIGLGVEAAVHSQVRFTEEVAAEGIAYGVIEAESIPQYRAFEVKGVASCYLTGPENPNQVSIGLHGGLFRLSPQSLSREFANENAETPSLNLFTSGARLSYARILNPPSNQPKKKGAQGNSSPATDDKTLVQLGLLASVGFITGSGTLEVGAPTPLKFDQTLLRAGIKTFLDIEGFRVWVGGNFLSSFDPDSDGFGQIRLSPSRGFATDKGSALALTGGAAYEYRW